MQGGQYREEGQEEVRFFDSWIGGAFVEERDAKIEVWEREGGQRFDEYVDDNVVVVQVWIKLVTCGRDSDNEITRTSSKIRTALEWPSWRDSRILGCGSDDTSNLPECRHWMDCNGLWSVKSVRRAEVEHAAV